MFGRGSAAPSHRGAYLALTFGVFAIGWSAIFVRWTGMSGAVSAFYRLMFAALIFFPWRWVRDRGHAPPAPRRKASYRSALIAGACFAADLAFFNTSIMTTSATNATLLGVNAPIFVALGAWILYGERPTRRFWLGFLLALTGMFAIVGTDILVHPSLGVGDLMALAASACYGGYILFTHRSRRSMDPITFSAWATAVGAACLLPVCLLLRLPMTATGAREWGAVAGLVLVTQVFGHLLIAYAMGKVSATLSAVVLLGQAPITALLAWPLLGERVSLWQVIGGVLVLAGILVVNMNRAAQTDGAEPEQPDLSA